MSFLEPSVHSDAIVIGLLAGHPRFPLCKRISSAAALHKISFPLIGLFEADTGGVWS